MTTTTTATARPDARHGAFHPLPVSEVTRLTDDSVAIGFAVPPELRTAYGYAAGQHVAVRRYAGDREIRRTYSICSPADPAPASFRIAVRLVPGGEFSSHANEGLAPGDELEVMTPAGRFTLPPATAGRRYAAIVGGSGITPVLSLAATALAEDPEATFCLVRSERTAASAMLLEEVQDLKDRWPGRLQLVYALSREERQAGLPSGRLGADRLRALLPSLLPVGEVSAWFLCGPFGLIEEASTALAELGVARDRVHQEVFHVDDGGPAPERPEPTAPAAACEVTAVLDGRATTFRTDGADTLLDELLRRRQDAPYACKGGVCGTCRAMVVEGSVRMERNFALEPDEVEAGYVLACQSRPAAPVVALDFDR